MTLSTSQVMEGDLDIVFGNITNSTTKDTKDIDTDEATIIILTIIFVIILVFGLLGNISSCVVIARNRSMHTATNFYLFSLAISDLVVLISGLPLELYRLWNQITYPLGEIACIGLGLLSETSTNATVLTITAFTVERYIAICHPFMSRTISKLSRAVRFIIGIWIFAMCMAFPQAMQYGIVPVSDSGEMACTVKGNGIHEVFVISSFVFFVVPMSVITVLYALIGLKLRHSTVLQPVRQLSGGRVAGPRGGMRGYNGYRSGASQRRVVRMLVAVALLFFVCWAPFHVQRLLAIYGKRLANPSVTFVTVYVVLDHTSGILFYLSTAINPVLYNIMSNKFRDAFKTTLTAWCGRRRRGVKMNRSYSAVLASRRERNLRERGSDSTERAQSSIRLYRLSTATTQLCDGAPRAQPSNGQQIIMGNSSLGCGRFRLAWPFTLRHVIKSNDNHPSDPASPEVSNSSLREYEEEHTTEEMTTFMYQVNCLIHSKT